MLMRLGKFQPQKSDGESIPAPDERMDATSDNRYSGETNFYTSRTVARWIGVTPTRVRQLSRQYNLGKRTENYWIYSLGDIMLMGKLTRKGRMPMRNVTPKGDPDLLLAELKGQEELRKVMVAYWRKLTTEVRMFLSDISTGLHNRMEKLANKVETQWHEVYADLRGHGDRLYKLEKELKELEEHLKTGPNEKGDRGRAASILGRTARLTLTDDAARAAA